MTGEDLRMLLSKLARWDPKFREDLIVDPKGLIERQFNISLEDVTVTSVVETPDTIYIVVPPPPAEGALEELGEQELGKVAGGTSTGATSTFDARGTSTLDRYAQTAGMARDWAGHLFPKIEI